MVGGLTLATNAILLANYARDNVDRILSVVNAFSNQMSAFFAKQPVEPVTPMNS